MELKKKIGGIGDNAKCQKQALYRMELRCILHWIITVNDGKYKKYEKKLKTTFAEEGINGRAIDFLKESHWKEFGVVNFMDRVELHQHLQDLKKKMPKMDVVGCVVEEQKEGDN